MVERIARERIYTLLEITAVTLLAWLYLIRMPMSAADFGETAARIAAPIPAPVIDFTLTFLMWAVMMVAMMLPSASPMILTFARVATGRGGGTAASGNRINSVLTFRTWMFAGGYIAVWAAFSLIATLAQYALVRSSAISNALVATPAIGAAVLILAGVYQFTPWKNSCLTSCQSPMGFFMTHWRDRATGALRMGIEHGVTCVGCCWMLMALLFVAGVMNLVWVAAIAVFVLAEKIIPYPRAVAFSAGAMLLASGFLSLIR